MRLKEIEQYKWAKVIDRKTKRVIAAGPIEKHIVLDETARLPLDQVCVLGIYIGLLPIPPSPVYFSCIKTDNFNIIYLEEECEYVEAVIPARYTKSHCKDSNTNPFSDVYYGWGASDTDAEVKKLVDVLNRIEGVQTHGSCSGHDISPLWVTFTTDSIRSLRRISEVTRDFIDVFLLVDATTNHNFSPTDAITIRLNTVWSGEKAYSLVAQLSSALESRLL